MINIPSKSGKRIVAVARHGWAHVVGEISRVEPIVAGRLSDTSLWKMHTSAGPFALREWSPAQQKRASDTRTFTAIVSSGNCPAVPLPISPVPKQFGDLLPDKDGRFWELSPWLPGASSFAEMPSQAKLVAMCQTLASVHESTREIPVDKTAAETSLVTHSQKLNHLEQEVDAGNFAKLKSNVFETKSASAAHLLQRGIQFAREQLSSTALANLSTQWCWGDAWHSNFLFRENEVVGIVDFATVRVDTRAADLARLLGSATEKHPEWRGVGIEAYQAVRPLSPQEHLATTTLIDSGTVLSLANWLRWIHVEQREFRNPQAARERLAHFLRRFEALLERNRGD